MKFKHISLCIILLAALSSCEDFLDLKPISSSTAENAYSSASDAEAALIGIYDSFSQEYYIWDNVIFNDVISDNHYSGGDDLNIYAVEDLKIVPTNGRLFNNWSQMYNAILKANTVLQKVPLINDSKLDEGNRRAQILGEASFLRAFHYYNLVKMFGGVPLITSPSSSTDPGVTQVSRSTEAEVYAQIIADLEFAVDNRLPDSYGDVTIDKARATKAAAYALLAKAYAQQSEPGRDYNKVLEYCNEVINSPSGYTLLDNFADLFDGAHYNNAESIMEVQFIDGSATEGNWGPGLLLPPTITNDSWRKFITPSHSLVDAFDAEGDTERKNATILMEEAPWSDEFWSLAVNGTIPFAYKWKSSNSGRSGNRQYIFRLADIILLKAEALNELGQLEAARTALNSVRTRAGLGATPATDRDEMKTAILNERRLELAQEAQRWDDLKRNGVAVEVMNNLVEIDLRTGNPKVYNMTVEKQLMPIPQAERNRNKNLGQNPGYN
jgi:starch-binding outer membrane protein, SusD/RagB family